jgi:DNA-binding Xre family transcriptional regulator
MLSGLNIRDMKNKQSWFNEKVAAVSPDIMLEMQLSAGIIEQIDVILKKKHMTQRDLAKKLGKSEAVVSRWTTGFPNLTLRSIAQLSTALGEPLIQISK